MARTKQTRKKDGLPVTTGFASSTTEAATSPSGRRASLRSNTSYENSSPPPASQPTQAARPPASPARQDCLRLFEDLGVGIDKANQLPQGGQTTNIKVSDFK
jgi:hypothetical protein